MNTKSSKPIQRYRGAKIKSHPKEPGGHYSGAITNNDVALLFANFLTTYVHVEEQMINVMASLLSDDIFSKKDECRIIYRSVANARDRIAIIRNMLEQYPANISKSRFYDEVINEFQSLTTSRNAYVHGLWWTNEESKKVYLESPGPRFVPLFFERREVTKKELEHNIERVWELLKKVAGEIHAEHKGVPSQPPPIHPQKLSQGS